MHQAWVGCRVCRADFLVGWVSHAKPWSDNKKEPVWPVMISHLVSSRLKNIYIWANKSAFVSLTCLFKGQRAQDFSAATDNLSGSLVFYTDCYSRRLLFCVLVHKTLPHRSCSVAVMTTLLYDFFFFFITTEHHNTVTALRKIKWLPLVLFKLSSWNPEKCQFLVRTR